MIYAALIMLGAYVPDGKVAALQGAAAASGCFNVTASLLAGEAEDESGMGTNDGPSSADAVGPFQFVVADSAWQDYGQGNAWNWSDAAYSAARALCAYSRQAERRAGITGNADKDAYAECAYYSGPNGDVTGRESGICAPYIANVSAYAAGVHWGGVQVIARPSHHHHSSGGGGSPAARCAAMGGIMTGPNASYMPSFGGPYQCNLGNGVWKNL